MSVVIAENFADFRLERGIKVMTTAANAAQVSAMIPSNVFPFTMDGVLSSGGISYLNTRDEGTPIDPQHAEDDWLAFTRGTWESTSSFKTYFGVPAYQVFSKNGTWCLSMRAAIGRLGSAKETLFGIWAGNGVTPIFTINGIGTAYVGSTAISGAILAASTMQAPFGLDIVAETNGSTAKFSVYVNNLILGTVSITSSTTTSWISVGWNVARSVSTYPNTCMSFVRDTVVTYDDGTGMSGRCGDSFYVQKMLPTTDVEAQWVGEGAHFSQMAQPYPVQDGEQVLSAYMFGQKEEYVMQAPDKTRGSIVADVSIEVEARNTGTSAVPFELTFHGITASVITVAGAKDVPRMIPMPKNPETGRDWALSDLDAYTAGFGIEARK